MPRTAAILLLLLSAPLAYADPTSDYFLPQDQRERYRNPDGSCVICSIGQAGAHHNNAKAEFLLFDSSYGPKVRGGQHPGSVARIAQERGIPIFNVEGSQTIEWIDWALSTGRYACITWEVAHMITAMGRSPDGRWYYVCDNNSPQRIDRYDRETFLRKHREYGGGWTVILQGTAPLPWKAPALSRWWK